MSPARRAVAVARVPVEQRARVGGDGGVGCGQLRHRRAQVLEARHVGDAEALHRIRLRGHVDGEVRDPIARAEQHRLRHRIQVLEELALRPRQLARGAGLHQGLELPHRQIPRLRRAILRVQPLAAAAAQALAVKRAPGVGDRGSHALGCLTPQPPDGGSAGPPSYTRGGRPVPSGSVCPRALPAALAALAALGCPAADERAERARDEVHQALARGERGAALEAIGQLERASADDPAAIHERALLLILSGEAPRVAWLLEDAVARFPAATPLRLLLAETALLLADPARAETVAVGVSESDPAFGQALAIRARAALARGELDAALALFRRAEETAPERPELRAPRVGALLAEGRFEEARRAVEEARAAAPQAGAELALALHHYRLAEAERRWLRAEQAGDPDAAARARADLDAALDALADFAEKAPERLAAWQLLVHGLIATGRAGEAADRLAAAPAGAPDVPLAVLLARARLAQGRPDAAEQVLRDLFARDARAGALPLAAFLQARDRGGEALAIVEAARRDTGADALLDLARAELLLDTQDLAAARSAIASLDDTAQSELLRARLALAEGDPGTAARRLEQLAPRLDTAPTHFWLGRALEAEGDPAGAARRYALAAQRQPGDPAALAAVVRLARERGAWREVAAAARELVLHAPAAIDGWEALVAALIGLSDPEQAEAVARRAAELLPDDPGPPVLIARALRARGQPDQALAALESARTRFGDRSELAPERVLALGAAGRTEAALRAAREAQAAAPAGSAPLEHARAVVLFEAGRIDEGSRAIDAALANDPGDPAPLRTRCQLAAARALHQTALRDCTRYLEARPGDAAIRFALGTAFEAAGDDDGAIAAYRRAAADDPGAAAPRNNLALLLFRRGDQGGALAAAQEAYALAEDEPQVLDTLGELYLARGLADRAVAILEKAHALDPNRAPIQLHLALAYRAAGREADARRLLEALLGRDDAGPVREQARLALGAR